MEDAHVAQTDIDVPAHHFEDSTEIKNVDAKVFGVRIIRVYLLHFCASVMSVSMESQSVTPSVSS